MLSRMRQGLTSAVLITILLFIIVLMIQWTLLPSHFANQPESTHLTMHLIQRNAYLATIGANEKPSCNHNDTVQIACVVGGWRAARGVSILMRSILHYRTSCIHFHLICDEEGRLILETLTRGLKFHLPCLAISFYKADKILPKVGWIPTLHKAGGYGFIKIALEIVLNVDRVIVLDVDMSVHRDITELWQFFSQFTESCLFAAVEQQSDWYLGTLPDHRKNIIWPANGRGLNTGVMLLELKKMREAKWHSFWKNTAIRHLQHFQRTTLAEQDIVNVIFLEHPEKGMLLPCYWNIQLHDHSYAPSCYQRYRVPAILHWNSPQKQESLFPNRDHFLHIHTAASHFSGKCVSFVPQLCSKAKMKIAGSLKQRLSTSANNSAEWLVTHIKYAIYEHNQREFLCACRHCPLDNQSPTKIVPATTKESALAAYIKMYGRSIAPLFASRDQTQLISCTEHDKGSEPKEIDVTLVLHASVERLSQLEMCMQQWQGPVSIAIYAAFHETNTVDDFVKRIKTRNGRTQVHIVYDSDLYTSSSSKTIDSDETSKCDNGYPVNYLRNIASIHADSSHIFMLDADFVPSKDAYASIKSWLNYFFASPSTTSCTALVVPAFETHDFKFDLPSTLDKAKQLLRSGEWNVFRSKEWGLGHAATRSDKWISALLPYLVDWEPGYEPYLILPTSSPR